MVENQVERLTTWLTTFFQPVERVIDLTVRDVIQKTGLSGAAVYKRIKGHGMDLAAMKDKNTGHFTPEAEKQIIELFNLDKNQGETPVNEVDNQVKKVDEKLITENERLTTEVNRLTIEVERLNIRVETLENERNFLRQTLEREQQLHGLALSKLPSAPALPPGDPEKGKFRAWWDRIRKKGD